MGYDHQHEQTPGLVPAVESLAASEQASCVHDDLTLKAFVRPTDLIATNHGTWRGWVRHTLALAEGMSGRLDPFLSLDPQHAQRLVFVCLGNINRSAFAACVAGEQGLRTASLGLSTTTGAPATELAMSTSREMGYDLSSHAATDLGAHRHRPGDVYLAMEVRHAHQLKTRLPADALIVLLGGWSHPQRLHLHDPHTLSPAYFRTCFALIESAIRQLGCELRRGCSPCVRP